MKDNKYYLMSQMKSVGMAYICWFILGCHYAYLGKWGWQILYWITLGGFGIWAFFDLFLIPAKVNNHNRVISQRIEELDK
ncbi:TM2 domain-containing protein [Weeksellaceae bacterium TAE3-ERU29]|nr:TM2 domain-containing protein [Weeksellaceae bacterium TAE3-ERU29]